MKNTSHHLQSTIANNVRQMRLSLGLSQEQLADMCGYHRTYIGAVERGERNITISTLGAIADALNVDATELMK